MSGVRKKINHRALFKSRTKDDDNAELSSAVIISARKTGQLNLSSKGMFSVPNRVWTINELTEDELKELHFELDYDHKEVRWWEQEFLKVLDLSCNCLTTIDSKIELLSELTKLDLHSNLLKELPSEIGTLSKLNKLDLSCNKLETLPTNFYDLLELNELNLKNNSLEELDPGFGDLIMLTHLDLSCNRLFELPIGMGYLVRLISIDLSSNFLKELPPDIMSMRDRFVRILTLTYVNELNKQGDIPRSIALQKLVVNSNRLEILPPLGELRKVEIVMFQNNNLTVFPDLSGCTALKELHLSDNNISNIDITHLEGVRQIKMLIVAKNKIEEIPEDIIQLINLELFDLSHNNIALIPACISIMPNLKQFLIEGNNIQNVRSDIIRCGTFRIFKHLRQTLDLKNVNITESIPMSANTIIYPNKYTMKNTKLFSLTGQNLTELPENILEDAIAAGVTLIDLSRNQLCELPEQLSAVTTVTDLKLTSNHLAYLPDWIGEKYIHLQALDLSKNFLQSLPASINRLSCLRDINISFNRFTEIPECIYNIDSLEILMANDNLIIDIDVSLLKKLKRLATLNLSNNNIGIVPAELGTLMNIRTLLLSGNCFKHPRQAILSKSTDEILAYLRNRIPRQP